MRIGLILFILFIIVPILEIAAFIQIGGLIGVIPTLLGCVVTAAIGAFLVRLQGFGVLRNAQAAIARNEIPVAEIAHGVLILVAGAMLMTPGYVTDAMGFLLLVPPLRLAAAHAVIDYLKKRANVHVVRPDPRGGRYKTIDGEAVEIDGEDARDL